MADKGGQPTSLAEAKRLGSPTYRPTTGSNKGKIIAAVSKEELKKSNMSLREFLNKRRKDARKSGEVAGSVKTPKAKVPASKRKTPAILKESKGADLSAPKPPKPKSTPKPKSRPRGSSAPLNITGGIVPSRGTGKADPYKYVGKGPRGQKGQAPVPTTEEKVKMAGLVFSGLGGPAAKVATKVATKFGKPFINNLIKKINSLTPKQQKEILQAANKAPTKTKAQERTSQMLQAAQRTQSSRKPLKKDRVEPYIKKENKPLTPGQSRTARLVDAAKQSQRKEIDPGYTGGALKKGGPIVARKGSGSLKAVDTQQNPGLSKLPTNVRNRMGYAKSGGKVVNRKGGGMVGSGNDLVASMYD